jgi:hypothetical protein
VQSLAIDLEDLRSLGAVAAAVLHDAENMAALDLVEGDEIAGLITAR